jgi:UDP:flavonoid glycosyltransferase YjiC (YdhE family)
LFYDGQFNAFRSRFGLPRQRAYFVTAALSADRYLALFPPSFAARPSDWPAHALLSGFCPWTSTQPAVPTEVDEYIADGDPPVLITMGTAGSTGITTVLHAIAAELDQRNRRGLFLIGDPRHRTGALADRAGVAEFAPLDQVLARCRAIIHHGGYGTTVAALLAGVPAVTISPMPDQLWYGRRVEALGAGIALPWRQRRRIGPAIDAILHNPSYTHAAHRYRDLTVAHDGIATTCDQLEQLTPTTPW